MNLPEITEVRAPDGTPLGMWVLHVTGNSYVYQNRAEADAHMAAYEEATRRIAKED